MGKSEAMKKAIEGMEGPRAFPAQALRSTACYSVPQWYPLAFFNFGIP